MPVGVCQAGPSRIGLLCVAAHGAIPAATSRAAWVAGVLSVSTTTPSTDGADRVVRAFAHSANAKRRRATLSTRLGIAAGHRIRPTRSTGAHRYGVRGPGGDGEAEDVDEAAAAAATSRPAAAAAAASDDKQAHRS